MLNPRADMILSRMPLSLQQPDGLENVTAQTGHRNRDRQWQENVLPNGVTSERIQPTQNNGISTIYIPLERTINRKTVN